jgi:hypothetical protein
MAKTKYDFIREILEDKRTSRNQRERILEIASREIGLEGNLEERVTKIEKTLFNTNETGGDQEGEIRGKKHEVAEDTLSSKLPRFFYYPQNTYSFLRDFNQDPILSTTCHLMDSNTIQTLKNEYSLENYNFQKHYELIISHFEALVTKYNGRNGNPQVVTNLVALIRGYLTGKDERGNSVKWANTMPIHWGMESLVLWADNNPGIPPNPDVDIRSEHGNPGFCEFEEFEPLIKLVKVEGIVLQRIQSFSQLVYHFKYLFHIRADNNLRIILENNIISEFENDINMNFEGINTNIEYFMDISKLFQAIKSIFRLILKITRDCIMSKPDVVIGFHREGDSVCFTIHHKNTIFQKEVEDIHRIGKSFEGLISNQINGMGELEIEARLLNEKSYRIYYWNYDVCKRNEPYFKEIPQIVGVKYVIRMRKKHDLFDR